MPKSQNMQDAPMPIDGDVLGPEGQTKDPRATLDDYAWVSKITVATIGGNPAAVKTTGGAVPVARIWGIAVGTGWKQMVDGETQFQYIAGPVKAFNYQNGRKYRSAITYLPGGMQETVIAEVEAQLASDDHAHVEYAIDIIARPAGNKAGYTYEGKAAITTQLVDPLALVGQALGPLLVADGRRAELPAPTLVKKDGLEEVLS